MLRLLFSTKLGLFAAGVRCLKGTRDVHIFYMCSRCVVPSAVIAPMWSASLPECHTHEWKAALRCPIATEWSLKYFLSFMPASGQKTRSTIRQGTVQTLWAEIKGATDVETIEFCHAVLTDKRRVTLFKEADDYTFRARCDSFQHNEERIEIWTAQ